MQTQTRTPVAPTSNSVPTEAELTLAFRAEPHRYLDVGHSRLAYWRFGQGPDLVLVHGWPLDAATFRRIVPTLAQEFTCHLVDLPGVGQSQSAAGAPIDFVSHAQSLRKAIDAMGVSSYALLAHDSGGFVARLTAAEDPRVTALVLSGTEIPDHTPALLAAFVLMAHSGVGAKLLRAMLANRWFRRSAFGFGACFEDGAYVDGTFGDLFVQPLVQSDSLATAQLRPLLKLGKHMFEKLRVAHGKIHVPVQLIWGTRDPYFPIDKARDMAKQFAGRVEFVELVGAKLFAHEDRADEYADHARSFLRRSLAS